MRHPIQTKVAIVGAGISGLSAAHFLVRKGMNVCLLEKRQRIGGVICSEQSDGFLVELGPNSTLDTTPLLHELFSKLGIADALEYANDRAKNRYIVREEKLHPLPLSLPAFIRSRLFSRAAKWRLLKEPFIPPAPADLDESLADFVQRRLGREFLDYAINPFVAGVYAGKPETLSVKSAFPRLHQLEQEYGSLIKGALLGARKRRKSTETSKSKARLLSFRRGLQTVVDALGKDLSGHIFTNARFQHIAELEDGFDIEFHDRQSSHRLRSDALLLTIPAHAYGSLPFPAGSSLLATLEAIDYPPVSMVYFGFSNRPSGMPPDGFGFLVPEKENRRILGTIWSSTIFSNRAPRNGISLTTFVGGSRQPANALLPDDRLVALVRQDIQELMGIREAPDFIKIQKWEKAIPQYRIGHQQILKKIERFEEEHPGIFISGNFRGGISVADCIKQSHLMSERIRAFVIRKKAALPEIA